MLDVVYSAVNGLLEALVAIVNVLVMILPDSPFRDYIDDISGSIGGEILGYVNYFLPLGEMAAILSVWLIGIAAYYIVSTILRWVKAIS